MIYECKTQHKSKSLNYCYCSVKLVRKLTTNNNLYFTTRTAPTAFILIEFNFQTCT